MPRLPAPAIALLTALGASLACADPTYVGPPPAPPVPTWPEPLACAGNATPFTDHLLVGFAGSNTTGAKPGFDLRYQYLAGPVAPSAGCYDDAHGCGGAWWGTWQDLALPPGQFVRGFVARAEADGLLPMFTWYLILQASGVGEGRPEVTDAATNATFMAKYLVDFRFFLDQVGSHAALVHIEPDFWGYAQQAAIDGSTDATGLPAAVASANPTDCTGLPNTIAGLGQCMVHMVRVHAPAALVALHGSAWASGYDCVSNADPGLDVAAEAAKTADFLAGCGAGASDLVVVDIADRDAGWREAQGQDRWIDATNATLPDYDQAFAWSRALSDRAGRPLLWWQVPVGNMGLSDTTNAWRDNKVEYFFSHPDRVAGSGAVGMAFGAGEGAQTTPETDRGYLAACAAALAVAGGQPLCP